MNSERPGYRQIEHTADLGVEVTAADLPTLFAFAAEALYAFIADPATVEEQDEMSLTSSGNGLDELLHGWLCEALALFNVTGFVGKRCKVLEIDDRHVMGKISGEKLDLERHRFQTEIKGVTYHEFRIWQEDDSWHARIIFDV